MKWQYTNDKINTQNGDYVGDGLTGRIISEGQYPEYTWYNTPTEAINARKEIIEKIEKLEEEIALDDDIEALRIKAESLGIKFDKRWGAKKLQEAIDGHNS